MRLQPSLPGASESPLGGGGRPLGLRMLPGPRQYGRADLGLEVLPRSVKLGPPDVQGSLLWGCVPVMGEHTSGILFAGCWQRVFRWDSLLFPKAFWRIRYKRLKFMFTFSVFWLY